MKSQNEQYIATLLSQKDAEIATLRAQLAELREAAQPFADAEILKFGCRVGKPNWWRVVVTGTNPVRELRTALAKGEPEPEPVPCKHFLDSTYCAICNPES